MIRLAVSSAAVVAVLCVGVGGLGCGADESEERLEFSALRVDEIGAQRAVVRFDTSLEASCELEYGIAPTDLSQSATDPDMDPDNPYSLDHRVPLEDLLADTEIFYRARATTRSGITYFSAVDSFRTKTLSGVADELAELTNIALLSAGAELVEVSSNFGGASNGEAWGADAALDGLMATEWSSNGDGDNAFITVQWPEFRQLHALGYRSRKMADGSSIVRSVRLISEQGIIGPFETPDPDQRYFFSFESPISTRTLRLEVVETTGGNTGAKEIELYMRK